MEHAGDGETAASKGPEPSNSANMDPGLNPEDRFFSSTKGVHYPALSRSSPSPSLEARDAALGAIPRFVFCHAPLLCPGQSERPNKSWRCADARAALGLY